MTVKELMKVLSDVNPDSRVILASDPEANSLRDIDSSQIDGKYLSFDDRERYGVFVIFPGYEEYDANELFS